MCWVVCAACSVRPPQFVRSWSVAFNTQSEMTESDEQQTITQRSFNQYFIQKKTRKHSVLKVRHLPYGDGYYSNSLAHAEF